LKNEETETEKYDASCSRGKGKNMCYVDHGKNINCNQTMKKNAAAGEFSKCEIGDKKANKLCKHDCLQPNEPGSCSGKPCGI